MVERTNPIYKVRRKLQIAASHVCSNEMLSKTYYRILLHKKLNLDNPQTFNEKLQWLKLYEWPKNSLVIQCADKFRVREYVESKGYSKILVPLLGAWDNAKDIDFGKLPDQFVLKCNHGCAYNIVVHDKDSLNKKATVKQLNKWLKEDFGRFNIEVHYSEIKEHKILCEKFLGDKLTDYKFFCFNGQPKYIYVSNDLIHDRQAKIGFFNIDGSKMELIRDDYANLSEIKLPKFYSEMLKAAEALSADFPFVRVDFFVMKDKFYFAELTFTPGGCMMPFNPSKYDLEWGKELDMRSNKKI